MNTIKWPHAEINYDERYHIDHFKSFNWKYPKKADGSPMSDFELKCMAVNFARANGVKETGMSVNEVALMFDLLEKKKPKYIVELGRNFGCSTRLFIQHVIRNGGVLESWDLKHWDGFLETMDNAGYIIRGSRDREKLYAEKSTVKNLGPLELSDGTLHNVRIRIADSMKTPIESPNENDDRFVDFLLIDTEHGLEHALGEYMRWRGYLRGGALIAFHDSTLPGPARAIEIVKEVEEMAAPGADRFVNEYVNERVDGYGIQILEYRG